MEQKETSFQKRQKQQTNLASGFVLNNYNPMSLANIALSKIQLAQYDPSSLGDKLESKKKNQIDKNVSITLVRFNEQIFDSPPKLQWYFQKAIQKPNSQVMVLSFAANGKQVQKKLYIRLEFLMKKIEFSLQIDKIRGIIRLCFKQVFIFLKEQVSSKWERQQNLQGDIIMRFDLKAFSQLKTFLKCNFKVDNYKIKDHFKPLKWQNQTQEALIFKESLNKECLKHKEEILFDIIKIRELDKNLSGVIIRCPVQNCRQEFNTSVLIREHLQANHPFLQRYGIILRETAQSVQFQFTENLLNYVLLLSRYYPEDIKSFMKKGINILKAQK